MRPNTSKTKKGGLTFALELNSVTSVTPTIRHIHVITVSVDSVHP